MNRPAPRRAVAAIGLAATVAAACQAPPPAAAPPTTTTVAAAAAARRTTTTAPAAPTTTATTTSSTTTASTTSTSTTSTSTTAPPATTTTVPRTGTVVLAETFDGTALDTSRWRAYHDDYGSTNAQLGCNTPANVAVAGGTLRLAARREAYACPTGGTKAWTGAFVASRDAGRYYPLYSRFEVRARVPHGQGMWPAFWLRHRNGSSTAEVDVMELFHSQVPGKATQTLHLPATRGYSVAKRSTAFEAAAPGTGGWHTFAVEVRPGAAGAVTFTFSVDGATTLTYTDTAPTWASGAPADATWDVAVNLAVGGRYAGEPAAQLGYLPLVGRCSLTYAAPAGGDPATCPTTGIFYPQVPATMEVDSVTVTRLA